MGAEELFWIKSFTLKRIINGNYYIIIKLFDPTITPGLSSTILFSVPTVLSRILLTSRNSANAFLVSVLSVVDLFTINFSYSVISMFYYQYFSCCGVKIANKMPTLLVKEKKWLSQENPLILTKVIQYP